MMSIEEEIYMLVTFLSHPAGFDVDMGGVLCIRPIDESCPPIRWEVDWEENKDNINIKSYRAFDSLVEAATFYVEKRHYLCYGMDFEVELMKAKINE